MDSADSMQIDEGPINVNSSDTVEAELRSHFGPVLENQPDIMAECLSMLRLYSISPLELFYKWESWCIEMADDRQLDLSNARMFKKGLQNRLETEIKNKRKKNYNQGPQKRAGKTADIDDILEGSSPNTPRIKRKSQNNQNETPIQTKSRVLNNETPTGTTPLTPVANFKENQLTSITPYSQRTNSGLVVDTLNPNLEIAKPVDHAEPRVKMTINLDLSKYSFKIMHQKLMDASETLDDRIEMFTEVFQRHHSFTEDDLGNPSRISQTDIIAIGRIASDSITGGRLNPASLVLETSRRLGAGARVPLKIDDIPSYALFPGQIVALRGNDAGGGYFAVKEIYSTPMLPMPITPIAEIKNYRDKVGDTPLSVVIASGPYTTEDDLEFEPLTDLINKIIDEKPDVAILLGPFLDINNPMVVSGDLQIDNPDITTLDDFFKHMVISKLAQIPNSTTVIMIPSTRDACDKHACWPQQGFDRKNMGLPKNFKCLPNPALFSLNEIALGVSTNDILLHLSKEEITRAPNHKNIMARQCSHILAQRNFYPLFPGSSCSQVDVPFLGLAQFSEAVPDILIISSELFHFAKVVENVVTINPGTLTKKRGPGTWAKMSIHPQKIEENQQEVQHKLWERTRVDIQRI